MCLSSCEIFLPCPLQWRTWRTDSLLSVSQSDCLNNIVNAEKRGKRQVLVRPSSKVIIRFLTVMQKHGRLLSYDVGGKGELWM